jgi:two-component system, LytTR family, response regulator
MTAIGLTMRSVVIDDEQPARVFMRSLLRAWPTVDVVGEGANVAEGRRLVAESSPDLIFLDVQMPGGSGFDVLSAISPQQAPTVVFTTAFDDYALRAFEVSACDYLLKPFDATRLAKTMTRVMALGDRTEKLAQSRLQALLTHLRAPTNDMIVVKADGRHLFLRGTEIEWIEAVGKEIRIHAKVGAITTREALSSIEERLDTTQFVRVHRSAIVNRGQIAQVQPWFKGDFVIVLRSGARVVTGPTYRDVVLGLLGAKAR